LTLADRKVLHQQSGGSLEVQDSSHGKRCFEARAVVRERRLESSSFQGRSEFWRVGHESVERENDENSVS